MRVPFGVTHRAGWMWPLTPVSRRTMSPGDSARRRGVLTKKTAIMQGSGFMTNSPFATASKRATLSSAERVAATDPHYEGHFLPGRDLPPDRGRRFTGLLP